MNFKEKSQKLIKAYRKKVRRAKKRAAKVEKE